jgi:hypothetical protein
MSRSNMSLFVLVGVAIGALDGLRCVSRIHHLVSALRLRSMRFSLVVQGHARLIRDCLDPRWHVQYGKGTTQR